jgi:hypothetical protein
VAEAFMTLQYEGPAVESGAMDVRQLAPALLATADLMREAHALLGVEGPVPQVDIQATRPGSFIVDLLVADPKLPQQVLNLLTSRGATATVNLGTMVGFVVWSFGTVRALRNRRIARTEEITPGLVRITLENGDTLEVPPETLRLALDADYRRHLRAMMQPLAAQTGVTSLTATSGDRSEVVAGQDLRAFEVPPAQTEDLGESEATLVLRPVNVAFTEGNKWRFSDGETTFYADIQDTQFLQEVDLGVRRFAKNDMLRVRLRTRQTRGTDGDLHTERTVLRVLEHISGGVQLDLFAEPGQSPSAGREPEA